MNKRKGFSLVEVILSSAVFVMLVTALTASYLYGQEGTFLAGNRSRAVYFAEEGLQAAQNIRDASFANIVNGSFGLSTTSNVWNFVPASDTSGIFTRTVVVAPVDTNRKTISSSISWQQNPQRTGNVTLMTYLTNWQRLGIGNWAITSQASALNFSGNNDGSKVQVVGDYAYVVRSDGSPDFAVINVSNPSSPALVGSLSLTGIPQNVFVKDGYAYVASESDNEEIQIIDVSNPSAPTVVGTFNATGAANASGIFVVNDIAYLTRITSGDDEFMIVDVTSKTSPVLAGSLGFPDSARDVFVEGNYAYVATSDNNQELKVIDISVPALSSQVGFLNLSGTNDSLAIAFAGGTVFIGQGSTLFTVDVGTPASPTLLGSVSVSGTLNDIALNLGNENKYVFVATSHANNEFKVVDVTTLSAPVVLGQRNIAGTSPLLGVAYSETLDRAFAVSQSNSEEFIVIAPQ